jgi:hypothetical protein
LVKGKDTDDKQLKLQQILDLLDPSIRTISTAREQLAQIYHDDAQ